MSRLGGPNFEQIPINRPVVAKHNNERDAIMQTEIPKGQTAYFPNTLGGGCPHLSKMAEGAFHSYEEKIDARKITIFLSRLYFTAVFQKLNKTT